MEKLYNCEKQFIFRMPLEDTVLKIDEAALLALCADEVFLEKVRVASQGLYESMRRLSEQSESMPEKKRREILTSIYKYYVRSKSRTTPFGLFSGVGVGSFCKETKSMHQIQNYRKHMLPDARWLYGYIETLEKTYRRQLDWKVTGAAYHDGNRVTLLYTNEDNADEKSIRCTRAYEIIESCGKNYASYNHLVQAVKQQYVEVGEDVIDSYLKELVENHILISSLRPTLEEKQPLLYLMESCKKYGVGDPVALEEIWNCMQTYGNMPIGEGLLVYEQLWENMHKLYHCEETIQIDTIFDGEEITLNYEQKNQIEGLANFLAALSTKCSVEHRVLEQYRNRFVEKYGIDREVSVIEMMDATAGIGAPYGYTNPGDYRTAAPIDQHFNDEIRRCIVTLYEEAVKENHEIQLWDERLLELVGEEIQKSCDSFDLYFFLKEQEGSVRLYYNQDGGAPIGGSTLGRFSIHDERIENMLMQIQKQVNKPRESTCEIQFLPKDSRNGNVCRSRSARNYVMGPWVDQTKELRIEDVVIGVSGNRFYARHRKTGELLRFGSSNMFNKMLYPNVYRFLLEIHNDGTYTWFDYPWERIFADFGYMPAIYYKDICIVKERWNLSLQQLHLHRKKLTPEAFTMAYDAYAKKYQLPRWIRLVEADNKMLLDTSNVTAMQILYEYVKKKSEGVVTIEADDDVTVSMEGGHRCIEIVANITKRKRYQTAMEVPQKEVLEREIYLRYPMDEWLYFRVYCKSSREEELIALELEKFAKKMEKMHCIHHFFMRYIDTRTHLRIRFGGERDNLQKALPEILSWLHQMVQQQLVGDYTIAVYEQEMERYGGEALMPYAHYLFSADSSIVEYILLQKRLCRTSLDTFTMAVISILRYTQEFFDTYEDQCVFLETFHVAEHQQAFKKEKERYLEICDFEDDWRNFRNGEEGWLMTVIDMRSPVVKQYKEQLDMLDQQRKREIIYSVIHLHCNRLIGTNRDTEAKAMCYAEDILHAKKYALLHDEEGIA